MLMAANEIVTICDYQPTSAGFPVKLSEPMFTPPPQGKANAAAVLWKVISLRESAAIVGSEAYDHASHAVLGGCEYLSDKAISS